MSRVRGAIEGWVDTKFRSASRLPLVDPVPTCSARSGLLCFVQAGSVKGDARPAVGGSSTGRRSESGSLDTKWRPDE